MSAHAADIRKVMEAASVATDAGRRAAKLAEAHGLAVDVVRDAEAAARDAAAHVDRGAGQGGRTAA